MEKIKAVVIGRFNLKQDLLTVCDAVNEDRHLMAQITKRMWGLKSPITTVFDSLIDSILAQMISFKAAWSMQRRLIESLGDALIHGGNTYFAIPRSE